MALHVGKDTRDCCCQFGDSREETVVSSGFASVLPKTFCRIQFRAVGRQLMNLQPVPIGSEPGPDILVLVIRGVVLDEHCALAITAGELFQESTVSRSIENGVLRIVEASTPQFDGTEDLDVLSFSGDGNLRWTTDATPRRM